MMYKLLFLNSPFSLYFSSFFHFSSYSNVCCVHLKILSKSKLLCWKLSFTRVNTLEKVCLCRKEIQCRCCTWKHTVIRYALRTYVVPMIILFFRRLMKRLNISFIRSQVHNLCKFACVFVCILLHSCPGSNIMYESPLRMCTGCK